MIKEEYLRFLHTLNDQIVPVHVRKIANLIWTHLDEIVPLTAHQGKRIKKIISLAQLGWENLNTDIQFLAENHGEGVKKISRLKSMKVGPFRGFLKQESFDLTRQIVLIYGANGTGKSSFCEALESFVRH